MSDKISNTNNIDLQTTIRDKGKDGSFVVEARLTKFKPVTDNNGNLNAQTEKVIVALASGETLLEAQESAHNKAVELMGL